jgi:RNA polymerase sigma factor (TIGR02999 family)
MNQLTELLGRIQAGDTEARDTLFAAAYTELHRIARARLRDGGRNTVLDTTCLVHESYLRFVHGGELRAEDRRAFFAYASQVMRSVIVNSVRERIAQKRGGDWRPLTLSTSLAANIADGEDTVLKVHEALEDLEKADPRLAQVAQMRNYGRWRREGPRISTSAVERTVNRLIGRRLGKGQHMCWTKRGAHLLLQVRCAVLNSEFLQRYQRWFPSVGTRSIGLPRDWIPHSI